ncbi:hypothetical protein GCM10011514_01680 [Emticicia aquatilis]|uniref:T9SS C-terminal target domain-containing protein n=1 Tax=Emticicia aquatilis TaxID=1537369 RepID=A0A916YDV6_9BACT|nr:fibronectin type III domain-containing protein [Emticicia aquatilis]GGD41294.1 hypothetical protein GCM10011514_01680 [Emticicia aquatilis]
MKNFYFSRAFALFAFTLIINFPLFAQKEVAKWVEEVRKNNNKFSEENFIQSSNNNVNQSELKKGTTVSIDVSKLTDLWQRPRPTLVLSLPIAGRSTPITVELARIQVTTTNFKVSSSSTLNQNPKTDEGVHYRGIVKGDTESVAAISIYKNEVRGFIADKTGKYEIGKLKDKSSDHIIYNERDLTSTQPFACGTNPVTPKKTIRTSNLKESASITGIGCKTVTVYFECDYQMYLDNGSNVTNVTNYVTSFFNQVATLYQNENIDIQISEIYVWTTPDPYRTLTTTSSVLQSFNTNRGANFNGNLAHFLTTRNLGGGIAYLSTLCSKSYAHGVSMVQNTFATYPTFSWTVECVTHELGHNLGSNHTQWCGWVKPDGTTGPIDNCAAPEGGCTTVGPAPTNGGTIMSYCHLTTTGINFANGFGTLPGNAIRAGVTNATCLATSASTTSAPTGQQTTNITNNTATLSWNAVPNGLAYSVDYKPTSSATWTTLGSFTTTAANLSGLLAGTSYDWRVKCDCSGYSTTSTFVTTGTASCAAPISLTSSSISSTTANLSWGAVSGATNYTVQYKTSSATTWTVAGTVSTTTYTLSGLVASTAYNWQVKANCSAYSATANFSTLAATCAAPVSLASSSIASTTASVSWGTVSGATSYTVQYKTSSATTWITAGTVSTTTYALSGLVANTSYNWQVKANCSAYSATASFTTLASTCAAPVSLASSSIASTTASVSWGAVSGATSYTVQYKTSSATTWTTAGTVSTTTYALSGLVASTAYNWQVKANCSAYSVTASFTTLASTCAAPVSLSSSAIASTTASVSWGAVSGATSYTIQYKTSSATTWTTAGTVSTTTYALSGLVASTAYNWQVKANCSSYSATASFSTLASTCAAPVSLSSSAIASTTASVSWGAVSGATSYTIQYKTSSATTWITAGTVSTTTYALSGLVASTAYNWQVKANCSAYSATASFTTLAASCTAPFGLSSTNIASTSVTLVWNSVSGATSYTIQYKTSSATTWSTAATVSTTNYNLTALIAGTTYNWQVKANCSAYSTTASFATPTASCTAPSGLSTTNITSSSATLVWNSVSGATSYTVQYKTSSATTWSTAATVSTTNYNLTALIAGTTYNWQVKANCSAYSAAVSFTTTTCTAPTGLTSSNVAGTSATIAWNLVSGAASYTIQYKKSTTSTWTTVATVSANAYSLTGLTKNTTYNWQIKANCSVYSSTATFTTLSTAALKNAIVATSNDYEIKEEKIQYLPNFPIEPRTKFSIFPNPAQNNISLIISNEEKIEGGVFYQIVDFRGKVRKSQKITTDNIDLQISDLESGMYIIQMVSKLGVIESKTLIKE